MTAAYVRRCPTCATENPPAVLRCQCGALLTRVDLTQALPLSDNVASSASDRVSASLPDSRICRFTDCAQPNPPGSNYCLYCNRSLIPSAASDASSNSALNSVQNHDSLPTLVDGMALRSLVNLPRALSADYQIIRPLPTRGGEAELLLVQALADTPLQATKANNQTPEAGVAKIRVAKIYRHGILPNTEVQQRIAQIDLRHRVELFASGISDGYAYELMEYCALGSLRELLTGPQTLPILRTLTQEISTALENVHAVGLVHRDLKPENILLRSRAPLDLLLTDFAAASILEATQRFTSMARTLRYAAPESLSGVIDAKADFWALGIILLEAVLGQHPFEGLSEAVILHHLTTRNLDLSGVADTNFRKLLHGLLLRDPAQRWGSAEIKRWLADDPGLMLPVEAGMPHTFSQPYHLDKARCYSGDQLAVALTRHWQAGVADIVNGQLLSWFRDVQKDQNVVRLLLEQREDTRKLVDLRLLELIVYLAPGIPPVWRGTSLELRTVLQQANHALQGDAAAMLWLDEVYRERILDVYARAGNPACASLQDKWQNACEKFVSAWQACRARIQEKNRAQRPDTPVNFDELMYGSHRPDRPPIAQMHARLLALAYDPQWIARLQQRLMTELDQCALACPWLVDLTAQAQDAPTLLVLESLLPEIKKAVDTQLKVNEQLRQNQAEEIDALKNDYRAIIVTIRQTARDSLWMPSYCANLRTALDAYFSLLAQVRSVGRSDAPWQDLRKSVLRSESNASQMRLLVDQLAEWRAINHGWLSESVFGFVSLAWLLLTMFVNIRVAFAFLALAGCALVWRVWPTFSMQKKIQMLAAKLY